MLTGKDVRTHGVNQLAADVSPDCDIFRAAEEGQVTIPASSANGTSVKIARFRPCV